MSPDQNSSQDRLQQLRLILRTMEEAVDDAKSRRTAESGPRPANEADPSPAQPLRPVDDSTSDRELPSYDGPHGRGRDIPGPDSLPRAKAKPKGFNGFSNGGSSLGRTG